MTVYLLSMMLTLFGKNNGKLMANISLKYSKQYFQDSMIGTINLNFKKDTSWKLWLSMKDVSRTVKNFLNHLYCILNNHF